MVQLIKDIQPRGIASAYVVAPFDEGKKLLESNGYHIISAEENAKLRIQEGANADVSRNGNWVKEGFLYVPKKGKFLTKNSPIMDNSVEATQAHRKGNEFYLTDAQVESGLANSVKLQNKDFSIPTNRFGDDEVTAFAFGNFAKPYGNFLREVGVKEMPVYMVDNIGDKPFVRQAWLYGLDFGSRLDGNLRNLSNDDRVRGVCEDASASEPMQKNLYTPTQISKALDELGFSGLKSGLLKKLS
jgi:hypothetical protein